MFTKQFWLDTAERVIRTASQAAIGALSATAIVQEVDWPIVGGSTGIAALVALLMCLGAGAKGNSDTASFQGTVG